MQKISKNCKKNEKKMRRDWVLWPSDSKLVVRFSKALRRWDSGTRSTYNWIFAIVQGTNQLVYSSAPALTMRWQMDIDSIRRRLKNYSQLQTTLFPSLPIQPLFRLPRPSPSAVFSFRYLSLCNASSTDPPSLSSSFLPVETFPELCKPFESSKSRNSLYRF